MCPQLLAELQNSKQKAYTKKKITKKKINPIALRKAKIVHNFGLSLSAIGLKTNKQIKNGEGFCNIFCLVGFDYILS